MSWVNLIITVVPWVLLPPLLIFLVVLDKQRKRDANQVNSHPRAEEPPPIASPTAER